MVWLACPYLGPDVELTAERERHVRRRHPNVSLADIADALATPDLVVRRPWLPDETLLVNEIDDRTGATHIVIVVLRDESRSEDTPRHWVVTAYVEDGVPWGIVEWQRS